MAKIQFTARKDPLLRDPAPENARRRRSPATGVGARDESADGDRGENEFGTHALDGALEGPRGVVAVPVAAPAGRSRIADVAPSPAVRPAQLATSTARAPTTAPAAGLSGRRYQTSISLPPQTWVEFDGLAQGAGTSVGELMTAVLGMGLPDSPEAALQALERLLSAIPADEGLLEERNYRLPLELREALDRIAKILAPRSRAHRSLLIRAILSDCWPASPERARELVTSVRVQAMRASLLESAVAPADAGALGR